MKLNLTQSQIHWRDQARVVAEKTLAPNAALIDAQGRFPTENLQALGEAGLLGLPVKEELGGCGADVMTNTLVCETLAQGCASTAMCYHMHISAASLISTLAEDEQIDRFVVPILEGKHISTYAISEPTSGSRWWHMDTFAQEQDDCYLVDSFKSFATSAGHVDSYVLPVRADAASRPHDLSLFIVDRSVANVKPIGQWDAMGMRGNSSTPVHFDRCRIPKANLLGDPSLGFPLLFAHGFSVYQVGLGSVYLGIAQAALDFAISHVTKRVHSDTGQPLASVETIQRYIASMQISVDRCRAFVYSVARYVDQVVRENDDLMDMIDDEDYIKALAEVKVIACETAKTVTDTAVQVCGGSGYTRKHPLERYYRDARAGSIMGPNDDLLSVVVGQRVLGMPFPWESRNHADDNPRPQLVGSGVGHG